MKIIEKIREDQDAINPYYEAIGLFGARLLWDFKPESWRSRRKIRKLKDQYKGEKCVIICNGPSLLKHDLSSLENTFTIGLNKINLLFGKNSFRPSCIVSVNPLVLEQNSDFYNKTDIPLFVDSSAAKLVAPRDNINFMHSTRGPGFAKDISISIFQGYTVTYVALQVAYHLGFSAVALIGADHSFAVKGRSNSTVVATMEDKSHFDPRYFSEGDQWNLPDLLGSEVFYTLAKKVYFDNDKKIVNCTIGGHLEVFDKIPLADFLRIGVTTK